MGLERVPYKGVERRIVTAKGQILAGTANATVGEKAVGTQGQVLVTDTANTRGVQWRTLDAARARRGSTNQSVANATLVAVTFDTEDLDTNGMYSTGTNPSRITIQRKGSYLVVGQIDYAASATGTKYAYIRKNGTDYNAFQGGYAQTAVETGVNVSSFLDTLAIGDYLELIAYQSSGGALNVLSGAATWMSVIMIQEVA